MTTTIDKPTKKTFESIIGQDAVKNRLKFFVNAANTISDKGDLVNPFPPTLLIAERGHGKTEMAREIGHALINPQGQKRPFLEVNAADLKTIGDFVNTVIQPLAEVPNATIFIDEAHELATAIQTRLLTTFNTDINPIRSFTFQGEEYVVNLREVAFIFATTDPQKLLSPLRQRFETIEMSSYSDSEIAEILAAKCKIQEVATCKETIQDIASKSRNSPREATKLSQELLRLQAICDGFVVIDDWKGHCKLQGFMPYGIRSMEFKILESLAKEKDNCLPVGVVAAKLGVETKAIQTLEEFLVRRGWVMRLNGRTLTKEGFEVYSEIVKDQA